MAKTKAVISNHKHVAHLQQVRRQVKAIQYGAVAIILIVVGLAAYGILSNTVLLQYRSVAVVNGERITGGDFIKRAKFTRAQLINQFTRIYQFAQMFGVDPATDPNFSGQLNQIYSDLNDPAGLGQKVIDQMVDERLIQQEAKKRGITVSADEIEQRLHEAYNFFPDGTPTATITPTEPVIPTLNATQRAIVTITPTASLVPTGTLEPTSTPDLTNTPTATIPPTATATLAPTNTPEPPTPTATPYTLEGFQTALKENVDGLTKNTGITETDYRKLVETDLYRSKLFDIITADVKPFEEQVWARHILVADEATAQSIYERLQKGEDFAALAAEFSIDGTKDTGGDLGWFGKRGMIKEFADAAFALKVGEISKPVQSQYGFHIIQVIGHEDRPLDAQGFESYKQTVFTDWLKQLRTDSTITTYDAFWLQIMPTEPALQ
jgi:parvulin-like peptidyl-prolyl isomerase